MNILRSCSIGCAALLVTSCGAMTRDEIKTKTQNYILFLDYCGAANNFGESSLGKEFMSAANPACTKTINGKIVAQNFDGIIAQITNARSTFGSWKIDMKSLHIIVDSDEQIAESRFIFTSGKDNKSYIVSARLSFKDGKIISIKDVHSLKEK